MQGIERDEMAGDAELGEQVLHGRDFVGFVGDIDMSEQEGCVRSKRAERLGGDAVMEVIEAASRRLAIQRDAGLSGPRACRLQQSGVVAWWRKTFSTSVGSSPWRT